MRWRRDKDSGFDRIAADLFAGFLVSMVLMFVVVVLQTIEIQELRRAERLFRQALKEVAEQSERIRLEDGRIVIEAESIFDVGRWTLDHEELDEEYGAVRTALANGVAKLDEQLTQIRGVENAHRLLEIRVQGHADCQPFPLFVKDLKQVDVPMDNLDLSALRAAALVEYLTEACEISDSEEQARLEYACCPDGTLDCPEDQRQDKRIDPRRYSVFPIGRAAIEPTGVDEELAAGLPYNCRTWSDEELRLQRRVVIDVVPRIDEMLRAKGSGNASMR